MADPEGFKLGSAWMDVKPNIDQGEWDARIAAAVEEAGKGQGSPLGRSLTAGLEDAKPQLVKDADQIGTQVGERIASSTATGVTAGIKDAEPDAADAGERLGRELAARWRARLGKDTGEKAGADLGAGLGDGLSKSVDPGLSDVERKVKDEAKKTGQDAGKAAGDGMSPLIIGALAAAGSVGGPLLLAGIGGAMVGATALILRQNKVIAGDFSQTGKDAASAVQEATAPLTADMHQALLGVDTQVKALAPDLKDLFANAEPDITAVTTGLTGFAGGILPGVSKAVGESQVIVSDFSKSLPGLGQSVGGFFTGLVHDANVQGQALNQTVGVIGNTVRTLGSVIGSASAAASADLLALTPVINGVLSAVQAVSSPGTVGALAGLFGAMKLDPAISSGLKNAADCLGKVAAKGAESGGILGKMAGAADGASGLLGKMAGVVKGPWGLAIGAGIGLASGLAAALMNANDATKAITLSSTDLQSAIATDGAKVGEATTAYVAQQSQLNGLADTATKAGVSLNLLVQAAVGNTTAQQELTVAVRHGNETQRQQQQITEQSLSGFNTLNQSMATGSDRLTQSLTVTNSLTDANQQLLNSVKAQAQQTADAIEKQAQLDQATTELNNSTNIFNATLDADHQKLVAKSQATADATVAALNLGIGQTGLNQALAGAVQQYDQAAGAGQSYSGVLAALNDTTSNLLSSEAGFTTALGGLNTAIAANGRSLDVNNVKGAANIQAFTGIASSADKAAVALYQSEVSTKGANVAYDDANRKLAAEKQAFIDAALKAGYNKDEVKKLADELFKLPQDIPINIDANIGPAMQKLNGLIQKIDSSTGTVQITGTGGGQYGGGKALGANAGGGPVTAGSISTVGEHGTETVLFGQDAYVLTHGQTTALQSRPGGASGGAAVYNTFNYHGTQHPSPETKAQMMRDLAMAVA